MRKLVFYLVILDSISVAGLIFAQEPNLGRNIGIIEFKGNGSYSGKELQKLLQIKPKDKLASDAVKTATEKIRVFYVSQGYLLAEVNCKTVFDGSKAKLLFLIQENAKAKVGNFKLQGNKFFTESFLKQKNNLRGGGPFTQSLLEQEIDQILKLYDQNGFAYCQILPEQIQIDKRGLVNFALKIIEGPQVKIQKVIFVDARESSVSIWEKALGIKSGQIFSTMMVEKSLKRLDKIANLKETPTYKLESSADVQWANLRIKIKEEKNNSVEGILGYAPSPQSTKYSGMWIGRINLAFSNFLGGLRETQIRWEKKDLFSSSLVFSFQQRYLFDLPLAAKISFMQNDQDTSYIRTAVKTEWGYSWNEHFNSALELGWERVIPEKESQTTLAISQKYNLGVNLSLDYLDFYYNPRQGIYYQTQLGYALQKDNATSNYTPTKPRSHNLTSLIKLQNFIPTFSNQSLMISANFGKIKSDQIVVPLFNQFRLGGIATLRGFREDQFSGTQVFWSNLEYRFLLSKLSRFFIFTDYGYFSRHSLQNEAIKKISGNKLGYGLGLRVESKVGLWGIDFGWGQKDQLSQGKVHIGVVNRF